MVPSLRPSSSALRAAGWLIAPIVAALVARRILLAPAERQLAQAQQALLVAERDELAATLRTEREELGVQRMKERLKGIMDDAERMRAAETQALAELSRLQSSRVAPSVGHWLMPGQRAPERETETGGPAQHEQLSTM